MPPFTEQDAVLLQQRINRHPLLRARVESLLGVVEGAGGDLEKADAAERRVAEELRRMGNEALTEWARGGVGRCAAQARETADVRGGGKKTPLAHRLRRDRSGGAAVPAGHEGLAALQRTRGGGMPGGVAAVAAGAGGLRRGPCLRARPGQAAGALRHRHAGEHGPADHRAPRAMPV